MSGWIERRTSRASWRRFLIALALLMAYSMWAFLAPGPWRTILTATGGQLPELSPGFPPMQPDAALATLGDLKSAYIRFQIIDIPYAIFNVLTWAAAITLGLKRFNLAANPLRYTLYFPYAYLCCEIVENALLIGFASGATQIARPLVLAQQTATTLKLATITPAIISSLVFLAAIGIDALKQQSANK